MSSSFNKLRSKPNNYVISALVDNLPGVLHKITNKFRGRGFNINTISIGPTQDRHVARVTVTIYGDTSSVDQLVLQLRKLVDVFEVAVLTGKSCIARELALIKVDTPNGKARSEIIGYANIFRNRIVDVSNDYITIEVTGTSDKIDSFIELVKAFGISEVSRTGLTALKREVGSTYQNDTDYE